MNDEIVAMAYFKILLQAAENHKKFSVKITCLWAGIQIWNLPNIEHKCQKQADISGVSRLAHYTEYLNLMKPTSSPTAAD